MVGIPNEWLPTGFLHMCEIPQAPNQVHNLRSIHDRDVRIQAASSRL